MVSRALAGLAVVLARALGRGGRRALATAFASLAFGLGIRRRVTLENLRHALPELPERERRRIARGAYRTMLHGLIEAVAAARSSPAELDRVVRTSNWALVERALSEGRGIIVATAHFGSWELLGEVVCRRGTPLSVVAKPLEGALNALIVEARLAAGVKLIPPKGSLQRCAEALARNELVCLLIDQSIAASRGVFVPFFGRPASTTPAASLLARRTGAPVCVAMAHWEGETLALEIDGPFPMPSTGDAQADLVTHTATLTAAIERQIRRHPEQWLWLHRRWKESPGASAERPGS